MFQGEERETGAEETEAGEGTGAEEAIREVEEEGATHVCITMYIYNPLKYVNVDFNLKWYCIAKILWLKLIISMKNFACQEY